MCEILAHARCVKLFPPVCPEASQEGLGCVLAGGAWEERCLLPKHLLVDFLFCFLPHLSSLYK